MSFFHTGDKGIMIAIRLMQLMLSSGASIEETMRAVADEKLGHISRNFDYVLKRSMSGSSLDAELKSMLDKTAQGPFKKVISILYSGIEDEAAIKDNFKNLAMMIDEEMRIDRKGILKKVGLASNLLSYIALFSLLAIVFYMMGSLMQYGSFSIVLVSKEIAQAIFLFASAVSLAITAYIFVEGVRLS
ncbi:MAG: type II secretion system F family protein [archaeon]|nr:type II secretion system F family protein [archaeon]